MPDRRKHRGPHPDDVTLFGPEAVPVLREAGNDLAWLLSKGYATASALKLVGDRYNLVVRQRTAVGRAVCSDAALAGRRLREVVPQQLAGKAVYLDGYNVLTTVEAALAGGVLLLCRDGTLRDMASMHGSFRRVEETRPALNLIGRTAVAFGVSCCCWYLDSPVSNSGRLKTLMRELAAERGWPWQVELAGNPDAVLAKTQGIVATADSVILDRCQKWVNLARVVVEQHVADARVVALNDATTM